VRRGGNPDTATTEPHTSGCHDTRVSHTAGCGPKQTPNEKELEKTMAEGAIKWFDRDAVALEPANVDRFTSPLSTPQTPAPTNVPGE
jgi:hypothetical protein